jgi:thioredoxin 1
MNLLEFQQKISQTNKPVVVDFWAPWCIPCRMTKPILEKLAQDFSQKVDFLPINADESREVLEQFHVSGIPTVIAWNNGSVAGRLTGAQNEAVYGAMFGALADGREVKIPVSTFSRMIRLGAGGLLILIGIYSTSWLVMMAGGVVTFLGVYDRCPIWGAVTGMFKQVLK